MEEAGADVVSAAKSAPHELPNASRGMSGALGDVVDSTVDVASTHPEEVGNGIVCPR